VIRKAAINAGQTTRIWTHLSLRHFAGPCQIQSERNGRRGQEQIAEPWQAVQGGTMEPSEAGHAKRACPQHQRPGTGNQSDQVQRVFRDQMA